ncbi:hypothetical protein D3C80_1662370 [compost metagenome]
MIRCDAALGEDLLGHQNGCGGIAPTGVEGQMVDDFGNFRRLDAVIQGQVQVVRQFDSLLLGNEHCEGDQAAVARRQPWAFPHFTEQHRFSVVCQRWRHGTHVIQAWNRRYLSRVAGRVVRAGCQQQ